jgi:hypothetical protein
VPNLPFHTNDYGLLHFVTGNQPDFFLPAMPRRPIHGRGIALGLRVAEDLYVGLGDRVSDPWVD